MKRNKSAVTASSLLCLLALSACGGSHPNSAPQSGPPVAMTPQATAGSDKAEDSSKEKEHDSPTPPEKKKRPKLVLECRFIRIPPDKDKEKEKDKVKDKCIASAQVCFNADSEYPGASHPLCQNKLIVACNGQGIYSGTATHTEMNGYEYIIGNMSDAPLIMLMYSATRVGTSEQELKSSLKIENAQFEGVCEFDTLYDTIDK